MMRIARWLLGLLALIVIAVPIIFTLTGPPSEADAGGARQQEVVQSPRKPDIKKLVAEIAARMEKIEKQLPKSSKDYGPWRK